MESSGIIEAVIAWASNLDAATAYVLIVAVLFFCGMGLPVPEDLTLITAGYLVSQETLTYGGATLAGFLGVLSGDTLLFFIGRTYGRRVFELRPVRRMISKERILQAELRIQENARVICFVARFLPGLRTPVFLTAGVMRISPVVFIVQDGFAALLSVPLWVGFGWYFGERIHSALAAAKEAQAIIFGVLALGIAIYVWRLWRGRKEVVDAG